jgi:IS30 family transposase
MLVTGYKIIGELESRTAQATRDRAVSLIGNAHRRVRAVTVDNGTEPHAYKDIEALTGARYYFATPHHSWERGTCERAPEHGPHLPAWLRSHRSAAQATTP